MLASLKPANPPICVQSANLLAQCLDKVWLKQRNKIRNNTHCLDFSDTGSQYLERERLE